MEVRKFVRKIGEWQEFWDSFESAIHLNDSLSKVDKFSYLRGLLVGPARSSIAGFAFTSTNYKLAVELLRNRYEKKKTAIQRAHVNELLNMQPVYNERDAQQLRSLCNFLETKHHTNLVDINHHGSLGKLLSDSTGVAFHQECTPISRPDSQKKGKTEKRRISSGQR